MPPKKEIHCSNSCDINQNSTNIKINDISPSSSSSGLQSHPRTSAGAICVAASPLSSTLTSATTTTTHTTKSSNFAAACSSSSTSNFMINLNPSPTVEQKQQQFAANQKLCRLVKKHPCLYDRNHCDYGKKIVLDKLWTKIAKECNDSVASCKERWRNIRAAFARSINLYKTQSGPNRVKQYYLHDDLSFLVKPMMRNRLKANSEHDVTTEDEEEEDEQPEPEINEVRTQNEKVPAEQKGTTISEQPETTTDDEDGDVNCIEEPPQPVIINMNAGRNNRKRCMEFCNSSSKIRVLPNNGNNNYNRTTVPGSLSDDADAKFLEALLPDIRDMNLRQKIVFKRKIYQCLEDVYENNKDFPQNYSSVNHSRMQSILSAVSNLNETDLINVNNFIQNQLRQNSNSPPMALQLAALESCVPVPVKTEFNDFDSN